MPRVARKNLWESYPTLHIKSGTGDLLRRVGSKSTGSESLENGRPKIVFKPYKAEDFIRFRFMDFHNQVQGCNGGYHNEDVRVITGYEKDMTPETYTAKLTVK